jgi:hypothetical protein
MTFNRYAVFTDYRHLADIKKLLSERENNVIECAAIENFYSKKETMSIQDKVETKYCFGFFLKSNFLQKKNTVSLPYLRHGGKKASILKGGGAKTGAILTSISPRRQHLATLSL